MQSDGDMLFEQQTSSVHRLVKQAMYEKKKILYKGNEVTIVGFGQHGYPGQKDYKLTMITLELGQVVYTHNDIAPCGNPTT